MNANCPAEWSLVERIRQCGLHQAGFEPRTKLAETIAPGKRDGIAFFDGVEERGSSLVPELRDGIVDGETVQLHHLVGLALPLLVAAHHEVVLAHLAQEQR